MVLMDDSSTPDNNIGAEAITRSSYGGSFAILLLSSINAVSYGLHKYVMHVSVSY